MSTRFTEHEGTTPTSSSDQTRALAKETAEGADTTRSSHSSASCGVSQTVTGTTRSKVSVHERNNTRTRKSQHKVARFYTMDTLAPRTTRSHDHAAKVHPEGVKVYYDTVYTYT